MSASQVVVLTGLSHHTWLNNYYFLRRKEGREGGRKGKREEGRRREKKEGGKDCKRERKQNLKWLRKC
jgi:hypothetical protein